jgi:hypothetical protein
VLGLGRAPDVALLDVVLDEHRAGGVEHLDDAVGGISKVLSWLPYSSAACAMRPTFGTVPIVAGSRGRWR